MQLTFFFHHSVPWVNVYCSYYHSIPWMNVYCSYYHSVPWVNVYCSYFHSTQWVNVYCLYYHGVPWVNVCCSYYHSVPWVNVYCSYYHNVRWVFAHGAAAYHGWLSILRISTTCTVSLFILHMSYHVSCVIVLCTYVFNHTYNIISLHMSCLSDRCIIYIYETPVNVLYVCLWWWYYYSYCSACCNHLKLKELIPN